MIHGTLAPVESVSWQRLLASSVTDPAYRFGRHEPGADVVMVGSLLAGVDETPGEIVLSKAEMVGLLDHMKKYPGEVSGGMKKRAGLARAQTGQPDRRVSMPLRELNECLAEELRRLDPDEVYARALCDGLPLVT